MYFDGETASPAAVEVVREGDSVLGVGEDTAVSCLFTGVFWLSHGFKGSVGEWSGQP